MLDRQFHRHARLWTALFTIAFALHFGLAQAEPVAVQQRVGLLHGFLLLRTLDDNTIAVGEMTQTSSGDRVTTRVIFRFTDGSVHDETTIFSQRGHFKLLKYQLEQRGPIFEQPLETMIDTATGLVTVKYVNSDGEKKTDSEQFDLPADLANGLITTLLGSIQPNSPTSTVSFLATTPKPRLVKLTIAAQPAEDFSISNYQGQAQRYAIKVNIGGIAGVLAPLVGLQPPDTNVWMLKGEAPGFVKSEGPLFAGGPVWRIELADAAAF